MIATVAQSHAALWMFLAFVGATLVITYFSARKSSGASAYFAAGRRITGWQNGLAVAGDYMSAASFLGIAGMIAMNGYDGFLYSVGFLVAYLTVLFLVAEPCAIPASTPWRMCWLSGLAPSRSGRRLRSVP